MKQLKCPYCGAALTVNSAFDYYVECQYCHQQVLNETINTSSENYVKQYYRPFSLDEETVMEIMAKEIANYKKQICFRGFIHNEYKISYNECKISNDIFEQMTNINIHKYIIPFYCYDGVILVIPESIKDELHLARNRFEEKEYTYAYLKNASDYTAETFTIVDNDDNSNFIKVTDDAYSVWIESGFRIDYKRVALYYLPLWIVSYDYKGTNYQLEYYFEKIIELGCPLQEIPEAEATDEQKKALSNYQSFEIALRFMKNATRIILVLIFVIVAWLTGPEIASFLFWGLIVLYFIIIYILDRTKKKYKLELDIDGINSDIEKRNQNMPIFLTEMLQEKANIFIKEKGWLKKQPYADEDSYYRGNIKKSLNNHDNEDSSPQKNEEQTPISLSRTTKFCKYCGKKIDVSHSFCRYCGKKQSRI